MEYEILPDVPLDHSVLLDYPPKLRRLLYNRNLETKEGIEAFLNPNYEAQLHDPFLLHDMEVAVERILSAIKANEKIIIYSDYDCDGIPGAVVLHDFFVAVKFTNFYNHIPHRHYDGFGLSVKAVEKLKTEQAPSLIITIDCGTTDLEAVKRAKELGIDVIITDHHEPKEELPEAVAVVNPKVGNSYPFSGLCGAGVVFKLVQALLARGNFGLPLGVEKWWLDMVAIATIADMVPLVDENRTLAHFGLLVLKKTRRPGLRQLFRQQKLKPEYLSEDDIGFTVGPRINAASRMDTPEDAFALLATSDEGEAGARLIHLEKLNQERKTAVALITRELHKRLEDFVEIPNVLVLGNPDWRPSLVGLGAGKLAEEYNRPVFLWGRDGNGILKGSCRGGGGVSVVKLMEANAGSFTEFGGHHMSGGFTLQSDTVYDLAEKLEQTFIALGESVLAKESLLVDLTLSLGDIDKSLLQAEQQCAPFGLGNRKPVYLIKDVLVEKVEVFGKGKEHCRLVLETGNLIKEAIAFFKLAEQFSVVPQASERHNLLVNLEESYFMGRKEVRFRIIDVV